MASKINPSISETTSPATSTVFPVHVAKVPSKPAENFYSSLLRTNTMNNNPSLDAPSSTYQRGKGYTNLRPRPRSESRSRIDTGLSRSGSTSSSSAQSSTPPIYSRTPNVKAALTGLTQFQSSTTSHGKKRTTESLASLPSAGNIPRATARDLEAYLHALEARIEALDARVSEVEASLRGRSTCPIQTGGGPAHSSLKSYATLLQSPIRDTTPSMSKPRPAPMAGYW